MVTKQECSTIIQRYCGDILSILGEGVYISDKVGTTLFVNKAYEQISGFEAQRLMGKNVHDLLDEGIFNTILNPDIVDTGKECSRVQELANNKRVFLKGYPVFDEHGEVALVVTFARDITRITQFYEQMQEQSELIRDYDDKISTINQMSFDGKTDLSLFKSPKMLELLSRLHRLAQTDVSILLLGETGVGKDVLARLIHRVSARKNKMFLKVDCGSISENLIESELFGYVPGAFSGAMNKGKLGYFEVANNGTILLDEIGELPLAMQTRFLRVLQDQEVMRVGASTPHKVDVRIVAATNKDLTKAIEEGTFRRDLFYRLNVAVLHIPPLREREEDIRTFAQHFLQKYAAKYGRTTVFAEETLNTLCQYHWPGNVRELQNIIQALVIAQDIPILLPEHLPRHFLESVAQYTPAGTTEPLVKDIGLPAQPTDYGDFLNGIEKNILENAIKALGSVNATADFFNINRSTIFRKMNKS